VTAVYAFLDLQNHTLRYAGAGHPPLLLYERSSGKTRELLENGLFLGFFPAAAYSTAETPFNEGDWVLLYTDGIPESMSASEEQFGEDRLKTFLETHADGPAANLADNLLHELSVWTARPEENERDDDVTMVAVRCASSV
jgi:serine phosphatase RsbU (regulator of sigma subunit)